MTKKSRRTEGASVASAAIDVVGGTSTTTLPKRKTKSKKGKAAASAKSSAADRAAELAHEDALEVTSGRGGRKRKKKGRGISATRGNGLEESNVAAVTGSSKKNKSYATTAADPDALNDGSTKTVKSKKSRIKKEAALAALGTISAPPTKDEASTTATLAVDPIVLARGMTSRYIGANIGSMVKILSPDQIESDLELMKGFDDACRTYSQKCFAFRNPELCRRNPTDPTGQEVEYVGPSKEASVHPRYHHSVLGDLSPISQMKLVKKPATDRDIREPAVLPNQAMPVRIDPEEEKRILALRRRIGQQEQIREELENQYTSIRAHFVRELQLLEAAKSENALTLKYAQQLVRKRKRVLTLHKVKREVTENILASLKWRRQKQEELENVMQVENHLEKEKKKTQGSPSSSQRVSKEKYTADRPAGFARQEDDEQSVESLTEFYENLERAIAEAEADCLRFDMPKDLVEKAIFAQYVRDPPPPGTFPTPNRNAAKASTLETEVEDGKKRAGEEMIEQKESANSKRGRSRRKADEPTKKKNVQDEIAMKPPVTSSAEENEIQGSRIGRNGAANSNEILATEISIPPASSYIEERIMPWKSTGYRRTPAGVPLYISQLSAYPDSVMGAGYAGFLGNSADAMAYTAPLDKIDDGSPSELYGLPGNMYSRHLEKHDATALRMEIAELEAQIDLEEKRNMKIQSEAIVKKRRCDELCSTMTLLRSETEAVLTRHNTILESEEAKTKIWEALQREKEEAENEAHEEEEADGEEVNEDAQEGEVNVEEVEHDGKHEKKSIKKERGDGKPAKNGISGKNNTARLDDADADDEVEEGEEDDEEEEVEGKSDKARGKNDKFVAKNEKVAKTESPDNKVKTPNKPRITISAKDVEDAASSAKKKMVSQAGSDSTDSAHEGGATDMEDVAEDDITGPLESNGTEGDEEEGEIVEGEGTDAVATKKSPATESEIVQTAANGNDGNTKSSASGLKRRAETATADNGDREPLEKKLRV